MITGQDIYDNGFDYGVADDFVDKLVEDEPLIVNTDISSGPGIHWVVMILKEGMVYIIDSLGPNNYRPYGKMMLQKIVDRGYDYSFYKFRFQKNDSLCGWFSIYLSYLYNKEKPIDPYEMTYNEFGKSADNQDIMHLIRQFGLNKGQMDKKLD